jgi:hypothetical protein
VGLESESAVVDLGRESRQASLEPSYAWLFELHCVEAGLKQRSIEMV